MAVQATQVDISTRPFVLHSYPANRKKVTIKQDVYRTEDLAPYTVLGRIAATGLYVPLTDVEATDGSAIPAGIYIGDGITAAELVAGNVTDCPVLTSGARFDEGQLVLENDVDIDDTVTGAALTYVAGVFDAGTTDATYTPGTATLVAVDVRSIRDHLESRMLIPVTTDSASAYEA